MLPLCWVYRALSPPAQATLTQALVALIGALLLLGLIHGPRPEWLSRAVLSVAAWAQSEKEKKWKMEQFTKFMTAGDELLVGLVDKNELLVKTSLFNNIIVASILLNTLFLTFEHYDKGEKEEPKKKDDKDEEEEEAVKEK